MQTIRIIIAGGRNFNDYEMLKRNMLKFIQKLHDHIDFHDIEIISGNANGADKLGERFAKEYNHNLKIMPAQWDLHGKSAGYLRNKEMLDYTKEADHSVLVAFWDGQSKGTKNMIDISRKILDNVEVIFYRGLT